MNYSIEFVYLEEIYNADKLHATYPHVSKQLKNELVRTKNWKTYIESNYSVEGKLTIEFIEPNSGRYEEEANIQFISADRLLKIDIWSDENFNKLYDIEVNINANLNLGFTRHFEGMEYREENETYLRQYIDPFLIDGWRQIDYRFINIYKTEMKNIKGINHVGPTHYHTLLSLIYYFLSFGGLLTKKIETEYEPIIKPFANKSYKS